MLTGGRGGLGHVNVSKKPVLKQSSGISGSLDQFSIILCLRISLNFTIAYAFFLSLVKVAILIVHGKKGHGFCSLGSETIECIKNCYLFSQY